MADGVRVVTMIWKKPTPRHLVIDGYFCKMTYYGQTPECDICHKTGHIARDCPFKGKCRQCLQSGHLQRDCPNPQAPAPTVDATGELVLQVSHSESSDSSSASSDSVGSSLGDSVSVSFSPPPCSNLIIDIVEDVNLNESIYQM